MADPQTDLFATLAPAPAAPPADAVVALLRARLHATLAMMRAATAMPWPDRLAIIHAENAFRCDKNVLPAEEGAALWAEFDREMDRLFALAAAADAAAEG